MTTLQAEKANRADIQALRGIAVLVVLLYHAKMAPFSAGYLGVDIFFVISGFLITQLVVRDITEGRFRFRDFYFRRAKRLLPAAYATFLATALMAPLFLTSSELQDFRNQLAGAVTFTANIVLWLQSGYFGTGADIKPLLHVWSLAIEEQYYLLLPAALVALPRRAWLPCIAAALMLSVALCAARLENDSTFYLLPTRAWELLIGSVGAMMHRWTRLERPVSIAFWPCLALLMALPMVRLSGLHPGPEALLICFATLVIILRRHPLLAVGPHTRALGWVGDISYSLYLVHWPLFAFLNNVWIGEAGKDQPFALRLGLVALSFGLAYLLNRYVEVPIRRSSLRPTWRTVAPALAVSCALVFIPTVLVVSSAKDFAHIRRPNVGLDAACDFKGKFEPIAKCRSEDVPRMLVWGDSYAMHLVPGLLAAEGRQFGIVQATRSACGPLLNLAVVAVEKQGHGAAYACMQFNDSVLDYLKRTPSVEVVVLSSPFAQYLDGNRFALIKGGGESEANSDREQRTRAAMEAMKATVAAIRALGKKVIVVAPPPSGGFNIGRCVERVDNGLTVIGNTTNCMIDRDAYRKERSLTLDFLQALPEGAGVDVISFDDLLCDSRMCRTHIDGVVLYRDTGHLTYEGSVLAANSLRLVEKIARNAR